MYKMYTFKSFFDTPRTPLNFLIESKIRDTKGEFFGKEENLEKARYTETQRTLRYHAP